MKVAEFRPEGARFCTVLSLALTGRLKFIVVSLTQGGGEYALPWARDQAPAGRKFGKTYYIDATLSIFQRSVCSFNAPATTIDRLFFREEGTACL